MTQALFLRHDRPAQETYIGKYRGRPDGAADDRILFSFFVKFPGLLNPELADQLIQGAGLFGQFV